MKTTFSLSLLFFALTACGDGADVPQPAPPIGPATTATSEPPAPPTTPPAKRTMGTARAMGTRPENLVVDPTFGSFGTQYAGAVLVQDAKGYVDTPATSPAGPAQPVLVVSPDGGQPVLVFEVQAGTGPLDVRLFIATKNGATPAVSLITPYGSDAFDVSPSATGSQKHGDRTYTMYGTHITDQVLGKVYLLIEPKGELVVAAPEVTSPAAPSTRSLRPGAARVALTPAASRAMQAIAARPIYRGAPRRGRTFTIDGLPAD